MMRSSRTVGAGTRVTKGGDMRRTKAEAVREAESRNRGLGFRKNTATVTSEGEVFASDDNIREVVESSLYYNPAMQRWMARAPRGVTVVHR